MSYLLFDIGGTNMRIAASSDGKTIGDPVIVPTEPNDFKESMSRLVDAASALTTEQRISKIVGGVPGPMDKEKSRILSSPNMPDWEGKPLKETLEKHLGAPVRLENDTALVGLGEAIHGAGSGNDIVAYLTISTGVGGVRIVNGAIAPNALGFEPGHQVIDVDGPTCGCGGNGHLEAFIGGASLTKQHDKKPEDITDPAVWNEAARYLAIGINNILVCWSPHVVVLGGSVMNKIDIELVQASLREVNTIFPELPPIVPATLGQTGGLLGALAYLT